MIESIHALPILITIVGVFSGAFVAGFAGFGLAAAAGALLLHVHEAMTAVPLMMLCSVIAQFIGLVVLRHSVDLRSSLPFVLGGALAVPVAVFLLSTLDPSAYKLWFGLFLVAYTSYCLFPLIAARALQKPVATIAVPPPSPVSPGQLNSGAIGFVGGLIGGMTAMPGAVMSVWADIRGGDKRERRSVVQPFILCMQLCSLGLLAAKGDLFTSEIGRLFVMSLPALLVGTALGLILFRRVNSHNFRTCVLVLILFSGLLMLVQ